MTDTSTLVDLLGETRGELLELVRGGTVTNGELAQALGISEPAVRRHLKVLADEGLLVAAPLPRKGRGRPALGWELTPKARRLYPDRSAEFANELFAYMEAEHGRQAVLGFLRWRQEQQADRYADVLAGTEDPAERLDLLAQLLSADGFLASSRPVAVPDGATVLELRQGHCAVADVAAAHPEICAFEAALFQRLLGGRLSRRQTIAGGASACVCTVTPAGG